jgi:hypothetical protein
MMLANKTVTRGAVAARSPQLPAVRPRSLVVRRFKVSNSLMLVALASHGCTASVTGRRAFQLMGTYGMGIV